MFFKSSLEDRVEKAKKNTDEMNKLIEEYKPFIASTIQKRTGRFLEYGRDDELTIGMLAFKESIESFNKNKGKFLSFAKHVINLRMIDYYRKTKKDGKVISLEMISQQHDGSTIDIGAARALEEYEKEKENESIKLEIFQYKNELNNWQIDFSDLVKVSPKQEKLRSLYKEVARLIMENEELLNMLLDKKRLPIKEIENLTGIHRKKLERGRTYIISLIIVMKGDYPYLKEYINWR
ncbi:putative RNA polymerase sigma factor SigI [Proteiniborus sp. DW1]|uniref:RNA polymerase sigma-I factor n=1 Tax=Proteiniborus sp. DW1 TaxID=1889883 RepID=UPI00092DFAE1|nr:RNA polymerase sigma-I factor [Proteiniborus sp. DW1]SCG82323.1 putative RNA polymerase sigma factor SigI [Proteiniborus sp. DW1]